MFGNIGMTELLIIAGVALIFLGPDKFPGHAKIAMRFIRDIRTYWDEAKRDIMEELKPIKKELRELERYRPEEVIDRLVGEESEASPENPDGPGYPYSETISTAPNPEPEAPSSESAPVEGRSENTAWQREADGVANTVPAEGFETSNAADYDPRGTNGTD